MISIADLAMNYGKKTLFEKSSVTFNPGKSYGLVGANGSGKSTLLRLIAGEEKPNSGTISVPRDLKLGVLRQDHFQYENIKVIDVVFLGKPALCEALREKEKILESENLDSQSGHRLGQLEEMIAEADGYVAEPFAAELLSGLGIGTGFHTGPMSALSGGFKLRVLLAQLLFQQPDVLLLDEPTNHLDIVSIRWLENYLCTQFEGTLIFISHDRNFLNVVASYIIDIDYEELRLYTGNYEQFLEAKTLAEADSSTVTTADLLLNFEEDEEDQEIEEDDSGLIIVDSDETDVVFGGEKISKAALEKFIRQYPDSTLRFLFRRSLEGRPLSAEIEAIYYSWEKRGLSRGRLKKYLLKLMEWPEVPDLSILYLLQSLKDRIYEDSQKVRT